MTREEALPKILVGGRYQHYKGGIYIVDFLAINAETNEPMVVYHSNESNETYTRPVERWLENVNVPRFKLLLNYY